LNLRIDNQYALLESLGMAVIVMDQQMVIQFLNMKARIILSADSSVLVGKLIDEMIPAHIDSETAEVAELIQVINRLDSSQPSEVQTVLSRPDGTVFVSRVIVSKMENVSGYSGYCMLVEDISAAQHRTKELVLSAQVFEHSGEPIMITDRLDRILRINSAFTKVMGYEQSEVLGKTPAFLREGLGEEDTYQMMWDEVARSGQWSGEVFNRMKSGETFPSWLSLTKIDNGINAGHHISIFSDITRHMHELNAIRHQAHHDFLTGLPNRYLFMDRLKQTITRHKRRATRFLAVLFVDLDGFKAINDSLGHKAGDQLLKDVASELKTCVREEDTVCRYGGDEFVILLSELTCETDATDIAGKLLNAISATSTQEAQQITLSIGVALYPSHGQDAETLISFADQAMYLAKSSGKNDYQLWKP